MYAADQVHYSAGKSTLQSAAPSAVRRPDPAKCPRCASTNTKFCYYNNYNKSQPRHFCKSCKRHWTKGGTLRNVPIGGARKNKRPKISSAAAASSDQKTASSILYRALIAEKTDNAAAADQFEFSSATSYHYLNLDIPGSSGGPWPGPDTGSCFESLPNYWNWSEIEALASSDHLNAAASWDEIKP